jgi:putative AlgH/UPF0301 family transcriptional regulator
MLRLPRFKAGSLRAGSLFSSGYYHHGQRPTFLHFVTRPAATSTARVLADTTVNSQKIREKRLLVLRIYRSTLQTVKQRYGPKAPNSVLMTSLLHRTGYGDYGYDQEAETDAAVKNTPSDKLFRHLLRELVGEDEGCFNSLNWPQTDFNYLPRRRRCSLFPGHVAKERIPERLFQIVRREFKVPSLPPEASNTPEKDGDQPEALNISADVSSQYSIETRLEVAFRVLRELNRKIDWFERRRSAINAREKKATPLVSSSNLIPGAALHVSPLSLYDPQSFLQPGTYLLAHPALTGYFYRSVICILEDNHFRRDSSGSDAPVSARLVSGRTQDSANDEPPSRQNKSQSAYGTYGLVVNRYAQTRQSRQATMKEVLRPIPSELLDAFGNAPMREGGPVHMSIQMLHCLSNDQLQHQPQEPEQEVVPMAKVVKKRGRPARKARIEGTLEETKQPLVGSNDDGTNAPHLSLLERLKGTVLPVAMPYVSVDPTESTENVPSNPFDFQFCSDRAVYYQGNIMEVARSVRAGELRLRTVSGLIANSSVPTGGHASDNEGRLESVTAPSEQSSTDVSFFVGASTWTKGQLADEIARGCWLPVRGPPEIALTGQCEIVTAAEDNTGSLRGTTTRTGTSDELWLAMMTACGSQEADFAALWNDNDNAKPLPPSLARRRPRSRTDEYSDEGAMPCDSF